LLLAASTQALAATTSDGLKLEAIDIGKPERLEVQPAKIMLNTSRQQAQLVVTGVYSGGRVQDLTRAATFASSEPAVVTLRQSVAFPAHDGQAEIRIEVGGLKASVPVEVRGVAKPERVSFEYGTLVALTKQGCNQGACHGSPSGKGGFRLSLRAYDAVLDTETLIREAFNRRTNLFEPERSLLLTKPLMEVAHGGGRRIKVGDPSYELLRDWIAQGCQADPADAPRCVRLEVYPRERVLHRPAHTQQMLVLAHFSDGSVRDVTPLASYSSSDEAIATVDASGLAVGLERGESAVLVRYAQLMETSYLTFLQDVPGFKWPAPKENNFVDGFVFDKLRMLQIAPSELCSDGEFIRRVYLDVIGLLPTPAETQAFLTDPTPNRREQLIDRLLDRPEFARFWAMRWGDLLRLRGSKLTPAGVQKFHHWLVQAVASNMPYDEFARTLITSDGNTFQSPPANFYRALADTADCTETMSQLFLGARIQCAKCHNHPFERWTQDNYYGLGAFFQRVARKKAPAGDEMVIFVNRTGEIVQPRTGKTMKPWLPASGDVSLTDETDRRTALANWLTGPNNPYFARVGVNRIWGHLMGRGIVEPVDDFRDSNPPSIAKLLDALARDLVEHHYDLKHTIRTILVSRTYQLSSHTTPENKDDVKYFSHARARLLGAEQLLDAICQVTGIEEKYAGLPSGTRATELASPDVDNEFLKVFGQPARETPCQCERSGDSNLSQALQMINGPVVHGKVHDANNRLRRLIAAGKTHAEIIDELYRSAFCRAPSDAEMLTALGHVAGSKDSMRGLEDVCWALLNANEFLLQH
jgi:hypothetical protein